MSNKLLSDLAIDWTCLLGKGWFGEVYQGEDKVHGKVAVKVFTWDKANESPDEWERRKVSLLHEGQMLSLATHENVVRVHYVTYSEANDAIYLVMEFCENGSLGDLYKRGPLAPNALKPWLVDIAFGLQALHKRNLLHRDIKPSNLLIKPNNVACLGDFGLVTDELILGYGRPEGYLRHRAPEMFRKNDPLARSSERTDIWAFGFTVYRLLVGEEYFEANVPDSSAHFEKDYYGKLKWPPHISKEWRKFVRRCMRDNPSERFQELGELLYELKKLPIAPDWTMQIQTDEIVWKRIKGSREIIVTLKTVTADRFIWEAISKPRDGIGRKRTVVPFTTPVNQRTALNEIKKFFESQTSSS